MTALDHLRNADVTISNLVQEPRGVHGAVDALVEIAAGGPSVRFAIMRRQRAPFPNEIPDLEQIRHRLEDYGRPLLVAPYVPESLGHALLKAGWSWADDEGNHDVRAGGLRLRQRRSFTTPQRSNRLMPTGSGSLAVIRTLIAHREDLEAALSTSEVSNHSQVSQPRTSQVLGALAKLELVERAGRGQWRPDRSALLDQFLTEYRGPRGTERFLYSLDQPATVAIQLARLAPPRSFVVSADVAADLIAPWRRPTVVIIYAASELPLDRLALVDAHGLADSNVIVREPRDRSVFPQSDLHANIEGVEIPLADPSQIIWDLQEMDGADRLEAAGEMRKWLLKIH